MKYDIVIGILPFVRRMPQPGPASIKSYIERRGFKCKIVDWNIELMSDDSFDWSQFWVKRGSDLRDETGIKPHVLNQVDNWVDKLKS